MFHILRFSVVHIALVSLFDYAICVFYIGMVPVLLSFQQLFLLAANILCPPCLHAEMPLVCLLWPQSIAHDSIIAFRETVVELTSFFVVYSHWVLPSAHPRALIDPSRFSFKNMRYRKAFFHYSYELSVLCMCINAFLSCNCCNSFRMPHFLSQQRFVILPKCSFGSALSGNAFWVDCHVLTFVPYSCRLIHNCQWNSFSFLCLRSSKVVVMCVQLT